MSDKIIYYIDPDTDEIVKAKYVEALSKTDYRVVIKENDDVLAIPMGAAMMFSTYEEVLEYKSGYYFVPMVDGQNVEQYRKEVSMQKATEELK